MGKTLNGLLKGVSGTVGPVVVAKGQGDEDIVKIKPSKSTKPVKQGQLDQQSIFKQVSAFVTQNEEVLHIGYKAYQGEVKPLNAASSYLMKYAVSGTTPLNFKLDLAKVRLSKETGGLQFVNVTMTDGTGGKLNLSWDFFPEDFSESQLLARGKDQAVLLLYNEANKHSLIRVGTLRSEGKVSVVPSSNWLGVLFHAWIFFAADDGKVSPTQYLGTITLGPR